LDIPSSPNALSRALRERFGRDDEAWAPSATCAPSAKFAANPARM
jgi:hypothetical protein